MQATLKIHTPVIRHEVIIDSLDGRSIHEGAMKLKQWICFNDDMPFVIFLEIQSKMNAPEFEAEFDDEIPIEKLQLQFS